MAKVVIIMGSKGDREWSQRIAGTLGELGIESVLRIASAHKTPSKCIEIIKQYENEEVVFITVAGRSNALSGFADAQTYCPVIACPPDSDKFGGADLYSSLRMPSAVSPLVVLEPENAALAAAKILGLQNKKVREKAKDWQNSARAEIEKADQELQTK